MSQGMSGSDFMGSSDDELREHRERIPTLQPGQFDGLDSWKDYLDRFETCAMANY